MPNKISSIPVLLIVIGIVTSILLFTNDSNNTGAVLSATSISSQATSTVVITTKPSPTTVFNCACGSDNKCGQACIYNSTNYSGYSCIREKAVGGVVSQDEKDSYCNRIDRAVGDVDGEDSTNSIDYFYYIRAVGGGIIPSNVNPDVNGDSVISINDRKIIVQNLK